VNEKNRKNMKNNKGNRKKNKKNKRDKKTRKKNYYIYLYSINIYIYYIIEWWNNLLLHGMHLTREQLEKQMM
jgi:hypothetical protein